MRSLFDKRLLFVTGKGGVGKSTVAAALGVAAASAGKRTLICEVASQERMSRFFHAEGVGSAETRIARSLYAFSIDPQEAMEEYLLLQVKIKPLNDLLFQNRVFTYFAAATPGLKEMVTIGKIWELAQLERKVKKREHYDLVIVDAPATGHGLGVLRTPKTFADIARVGPIKHQAETIHRFITDPEQTGIVGVCLPEEMPVNETFDLQRSLRTDLGLDFDRVFCNGLYPELFSADEVDLARAELAEHAGGNGDPDRRIVRGALRAALSEAARVGCQREQVERLERKMDRPVTHLPFIFDRELDVSSFERLAQPIGATLEAVAA